MYVYIQCFSPQHTVCVLVASETCWMHFLPQKWFAKQRKFWNLTSMFTSSSLPYLCGHVAAFLDTLPPPVEQWQSVKPSAEMGIMSPTCVCASFYACTRLNKTGTPQTLLRSATSGQKFHIDIKSQNIKLETTIIPKLIDRFFLIHWLPLDSN